MTATPRPSVLSGRTFWIECAAHGRVSLERVAYNVFCPLCAAVAPTREVRHEATPQRPNGWTYTVFDPPLPLLKVRTITLGKRARRGSGHQCDARCLNGKTSCDCQCGGRCHGAGSCACSTVETDKETTR